MCLTYIGRIPRCIEMAQHKYIIYFLFLWNCFDVIESSENLAYKKFASQSPSWDSNPASYAVDGDTDQNFQTGTCTHTNEGPKAAWWQVDLGFMSEIKRIKLYYRENNKQRLNGYEIHIVQSLNPLSSSLCYKDPVDVLPDLTITKECSYKGRYVNMSVERESGITYKGYDDGKGAVINLCEFQVYGCKIGFYGQDNCDTPCSLGCNNSRCDPDDGTCNCTVGWKGDKCTVCTESGFYGISCDIPCPAYCVGTKCDPQNGTCTEGCQNSKFGKHCNKTCPINCVTCDQSTGRCNGECKHGSHGTYCNLTCPSRCKNNICFKHNGTCTDGCKPSFQGIKCTDCVSGVYGSDCNKSCPESCSRIICNGTSGLCLHGCKNQNFKDNTTCEDCKTGFRGSDCKSKCPLNCQKFTCQKEKGDCTFGCIGNHSGPKCEECRPKYYGETCNLSCPIGCDGNGCEQTNGSCIKGCKAGTYSAYCNLTCSSKCATKSCNQVSGNCHDSQNPNQTSTNTASTIGGVVAAILVVLVLVIVVIIILKRRRLQKTQTKYKEKEEMQPSYSSPMKPVKNKQKQLYVNTREVEDQRQDGLVADDTPTTSRDDVYVNAPEIQTTQIPITELSTLISKKSAGNEFDKEYKKLPSGAIHPHKIGQKAENKIKNRFLTTFPYDHSRIVLEINPGQSKSDYINANYIDGVEKRFLYVATQGKTFLELTFNDTGPKSNTLSEFWNMVWQVEAGKIVMLTNIIENGKRKCEKYWSDNSQSKDVGHLRITSEMEKEYAFYIARSLTLYNKKTKETRTIKQFHFTMWPDHGTPDPVQLMMFHRKFRDAEASLEGPCIIHCSAGIGRTGTFIALDALHEFGERTGRIDIFEYVIRMRKDRMNMIQTVDQYIVLHEALLESFQYTGRTMKKDQFFTVCNEMQDGKPKNQTHVYKEYQNLSSLRPVYGIEYYDSAREEINKRKSRNHNILAVDKYRPYLMSHHSSRTNFINAVILPSCKLRCGYLATHYPLQHTIVDLWCMIFDHGSSTVAVLDEHGDKGENLQWYPTEDKKMNVEQLTITKVSGPHTYNKVQEMEFTVKHKEREEQKSVKMFMLRPWPTGQCAPPDKTELLKLLELVDNCQKIGSGPVTVICSDGARCCGLFCAVSNVIQNLQIDDEIDIFHTVRQLQLRRPEFFTDFEAYEHCYDMIKCYLQLTNVYANT